MTTAQTVPAPSALPSRERAAILAALAAVIAIAWLYEWRLAQDMASGPMAGMDDMVMPSGPWGATDFALMLVMWWVMMTAMMLPGAAPVILTFATVNRRKRARGQPFVPTALFAAGYLLAWGAFSLAATLAQWGLDRGALLSPVMKIPDAAWGGALFLAAGLYQVTPLKGACLHQCRTPLAFVLNHWREGRWGALNTGIAHGIDCLGCCWVLMLLLFAGGVMNLAWQAAIAAFVLAEKAVPGGRWVGRAGGALMIAFGAYLLTRP